MKKINEKKAIRIEDKTGRAHYIPEKWDPNRSRVSYGNGKTGLPSVNLLPGDMATEYAGSFPAVLRPHFEGICGTCSGDCPGCYFKKVTRNIEPAIMVALNTIEAKEDPARFWALVERELYNDAAIIEYKVIRIHDGGDFFSPEYLAAFVDFVKRHPATRFGTYTKEADKVKAYGLENLPANLVMSCSPWPGYCEAIGDLPQFCYDDGSDPELATLPHCPAVDKNGKRTGVQCKDCLHCYKAKRGDRWAVYAH